MIHLLGHALSVIPSADLVLSLIIKRRQSCVDRARQKVPSIRCELMSIRGSLDAPDPNAHHAMSPIGT
jgi:hypothetical protein